MARLKRRFFRWLGDQIHDATWEHDPGAKVAFDFYVRARDSSIVKSLQVGATVTWIDKNKDEHFP